MAVEHVAEVLTHDCVYTGKPSAYNRKLKVHYSIPAGGVNGETGLLLLIAGFGGTASANVYRKMRDVFADRYNLVTVQCDYFGSEFMQGAEAINYNLDINKLRAVLSPADMARVCPDGALDFNALLTVGSNYPLQIEVNAVLNENAENFNDMGLMQAVDNIVATVSVIDLLAGQGHRLDPGRVISYGHSHGAYLAHMCNAFAPRLYSLIVDNSAWLRPNYLARPRLEFSSYGQTVLVVAFDYLAAKLLDDPEITDLSFLYGAFENNCDIVCYQGSDDELIKAGDKADFCRKVPRCSYNEISAEKVDNAIFHSARHGLGADFLQLFDHTIGNLTAPRRLDRDGGLCGETIFRTAKRRYVIDYRDRLPIVRIR